MKIFLTITKRFLNERFFDQAAQTAYYLLLSMFPFLIFIFSVVNLFPVEEGTLFTLLKPFVPPESFPLIKDNVYAFVDKGHGKVLYLSLASAFWLSSISVQSLARSLDLANGRLRRYAFWKVLIRDLGVTLLFMIVVPLSLLLPIIESLLYDFLTYNDTIEEWKGLLYIWPGVKWGLGSLFLFVFFILFYKIVPTGKLTVKEVLPGAIFSAIGWQLFSLLFGNYVSTVNYSRLYGQLTSIILLVLWFYMSAVIILLSGLLNAEWRKIKRDRRHA